MTPRCDLCGKFKKEPDVVCMQSDSDEQWLECVDCMSPVDHERYFKTSQAKEGE